MMVDLITYNSPRSSLYVNSSNHRSRVKAILFSICQWCLQLKKWWDKQLRQQQLNAVPTKLQLLAILILWIPSSLLMKRFEIRMNFERLNPPIGTCLLRWTPKFLKLGSMRHCKMLSISTSQEWFSNQNIKIQYPAMVLIDLLSLMLASLMSLLTASSEPYSFIQSAFTSLSRNVSSTLRESILLSQQFGKFSQFYSNTAVRLITVCLSPKSPRSTRTNSNDLKENSSRSLASKQLMNAFLSRTWRSYKSIQRSLRKKRTVNALWGWS